MAKSKQERFKERRYLAALATEDEPHQVLHEFKKGKPVKILDEELKELIGKKIVEIDDGMSVPKIKYPESIIVFVVE